VGTQQKKIPFWVICAAQQGFCWISPEQSPEGRSFSSAEWCFLPVGGHERPTSPPVPPQPTKTRCCRHPGWVPGPTPWGCGVSGSSVTWMLHWGGETDRDAAGPQCRDARAGGGEGGQQVRGGWGTSVPTVPLRKCRSKAATLRICSAEVKVGADFLQGKSSNLERRESEGLGADVQGVEDRVGSELSEFLSQSHYLWALNLLFTWQNQPGTTPALLLSPINFQAMHCRPLPCLQEQVQGQQHQAHVPHPGHSQPCQPSSALLTEESVAQCSRTRWPRQPERVEASGTGDNFGGDDSLPSEACGQGGCRNTHPGRARTSTDNYIAGAFHMHPSGVLHPVLGSPVQER